MKTKTIGLASMLVLTLTLNGCSSKPEASDIEKQLVDYWKPCTFVTPKDLKKTNGIDQGNTYEMQISYRLEINKEIVLDANAQSPLHADVAYFEAHCPEPLNSRWLPRLLGIARENNISLSQMKKGDAFTISESITMVKSEKGWVVQ